MNYSLFSFASLMLLELWLWLFISSYYYIFIVSVYQLWLLLQLVVFYLSGGKYQTQWLGHVGWVFGYWTTYQVQWWETAPQPWLCLNINTSNGRIHVIKISNQWLCSRCPDAQIPMQKHKTCETTREEDFWRSAVPQ
jgi:hypothetical protein